MRRWKNQPDRASHQDENKERVSRPRIFKDVMQVDEERSVQSYEQEPDWKHKDQIFKLEFPFFVKKIGKLFDVLHTRGNQD